MYFIDLTNSSVQNQVLWTIVVQKPQKSGASFTHIAWTYIVCQMSFTDESLWLLWKCGSNLIGSIWTSLNFLTVTCPNNACNGADRVHVHAMRMALQAEWSPWFLLFSRLRSVWLWSCDTGWFSSLPVRLATQSVLHAAIHPIAGHIHLFWSH
jgi:hypothetical protein